METPQHKGVLKYVQMIILQAIWIGHVFKLVQKITEFMTHSEITKQEFVKNTANNQMLMLILKILIDSVLKNVLKPLSVLLQIPQQNIVFPNALLILLFLVKKQPLLVYHSVQVILLLILIKGYV